jgi:hypothetical protein
VPCGSPPALEPPLAFELPPELAPALELELPLTPELPVPAFPPLEPPVPPDEAPAVPPLPIASLLTAPESSDEAHPAHWTVIAASPENNTACQDGFCIQSPSDFCLESTRSAPILGLVSERKRQEEVQIGSDSLRGPIAGLLEQFIFLSREACPFVSY